MYDKDNKYGIGYLDAGHGIDFGLSEVALTNLAGKTRTAKESIALGGVAEAGTAAANAGNVFPSDVTADWSRLLAEKVLHRKLHTSASEFTLNFEMFVF